MSVEHVCALARYNRWMNEKLYALAAELPDQERKKDKGAFFKSIHGTFNHLMVADRIWVSRLTGDAKLADGITGLDHEFTSDFDELRGERSKMDARIDAYVATLTDDKLAGNITFVRRGAEHTCPLWFCVIHMFNHQTHHRGQVTTLFMQAGRDPGVTDLFAMLLTEPR